MKKILFILLIFFAFKSYGQLPTQPYTKMTAKWYHFDNYVSVDSLFFFGVRDTLVTPYRPGAVVFWLNVGTDSTLWLWDGLRWKTFTGSSGTGAVSSVGLTMPTGFTVTNSPIVNSGVIDVSTTLDGILKGDGSGFGVIIVGTGLTYDGTTLSANGIGGEDIQETLNIGRDLTQVDSIQSNSYFNLTSTTAPIAISAKGQGLLIQNYTGQPRITFKNDLGETPDNDLGAMISGSANGGAIVFKSNFNDNSGRLKLGWLDNDLNFTPYITLSEVEGINNTSITSVTRVYDSLFAYFIPNGNPGVDSVLVESGGLISKVAASSFATTITANNGLTMSTATNVQLGGSLIQTTYIHGDNNGMTIDSLDGFIVNANTFTYGSYPYDVNNNTAVNFSVDGFSLVKTGTGDLISDLNAQTGSIALESYNSGLGNNYMALIVYDSLVRIKAQLVADSLFTVYHNGKINFAKYTPSAFTGTPTNLLATDASGYVIQTSITPSIGLTRQIITSGTSGTVTGGNYIVTIDPASTLATYTLTLPASPSDLDIVQVDFGGTLTSGGIVTSLTISPNSGQTILDNTPPVSATADNVLFYRYRAANTKWYRFKP